MTLAPQRSLAPTGKSSSNDLGFISIGTDTEEEEQVSEQLEMIPSKESDVPLEIEQVSEQPEMIPSREEEEPEYETVNLDEVEEQTPEEKELGFQRIDSPLEGLFGEDSDLTSNQMNKFAKGLSVIGREGTAVTTGLVGDIQTFADMASDWTMTKFLGEDKMQDVRARMEEAGVDRIMPNSQEIKDTIDRWSDGRFQPDNPLERFIARATSFLAFPGKKTLGRVASDIGASILGQTAEELDAGPAVEFGATIVGGGLGAKAAAKYSGERAIRPLLERVSEQSKQEMTAMVMGKITPEVQAVAKAAKAQGITLPLSTMAGRSVTKATEKLLEKNVFSREAFVELAGAEKGKFLEQWQKNLEAISTMYIENPAVAGQLAQESALKIEKSLKTTRDVAYKEVKDYMKLAKVNDVKLGVSNIGAKSLLEDLSKELSTSLIPSATEKGVKDTFTGALENIERYQKAIEKDVINTTIKDFGKRTIPASAAESNQKILNAAKGKTDLKSVKKAVEEVMKEDPTAKVYGKNFLKTLGSEVNSGKRFVDLDTIMSSERSLKDIIDWDTRGSASQLVKAVLGKFSGAIETYSKKDPIFGEAYKRAKEAHKDLAKTSWNDLTKSLLTNQFPDTMIKKMQNPSMFNSYEKLFNKTTEGKKTFATLRRFSLENFIGKGVIDQVTGDLKTGTFASKMKHKQNQSILKNLMGEDQFKVAKDLGKIADGLTKGAKDFLNPPQTADVLLLTKSLIAPISAAVGVGAKSGLVSVPAVGAGLSAIYGPKLLAGAMTNELLLSSAREAAIAGKKGNKVEFLKAIGELTSEYLKEVDKVRQAQASLQALRKQEKKSE
jgi:hypothetical protein